MSFRNGWAGCSPFVFASAIGLVACVGDAVTPKDPPDASSNDAQTTPDSSTADTGPSGDSSTSDGASETGPVESGVDAGPCSKAQVGATFNLPTNGGNFFHQQSVPITAGVYTLTSAYNDCGCSSVAAAADGGLIITINGPTVTIERRIELQSQNVTQTVLDRWSGTFSQLGQNLEVMRECPTTTSTPTNWFANFLPVDGGKAQVEMFFPNELQVQNVSPSGMHGPTFVFTHQ